MTEKNTIIKVENISVKCIVCKKEILQNEKSVYRLGNWYIHIPKCDPRNAKCIVCNINISEDDIFLQEGFSVKVAENDCYEFAHGDCAKGTPPALSTLVKSIDDLFDVEKMILSKEQCAYHFSKTFWNKAYAKENMINALIKVSSISKVYGCLCSAKQIINRGIIQINKGDGETNRIIVYEYKEYPVLTIIPKNTLMILVKDKEEDED